MLQSPPQVSGTRLAFGSPRLGRSHQKTPCYVLKLRSMFLPCVFARSGVSATPQRLWPAARWTGNCTGTEEGKTSGVACSQATPLPSPLDPKGVRVALSYDKGSMNTYFRKPSNQQARAREGTRGRRKDGPRRLPEGGEVSTDGTVEFRTLGGIQRMQDDK